MSSRVLIAGGGVASLEATIALQDMAGDRVEVEIYSPHEDFVYRPFAVTEPFGISHAMRYDLRRLAERMRRPLPSRQHRPCRWRGETSPNTRRRGNRFRLPDRCLRDSVACRRRGRFELLGEFPDDPKVREAVRDLRDRKLKRAVFTMPAGGTWALPLYELALLAESELSKAGVEDSSLTVVTPEEAPLHLFGRRASKRVSELLAERDIEVIAGATPIKYDSGLLTVSPAPPSRPTSSSASRAWRVGRSVGFLTTWMGSSRSTIMAESWVCSTPSPPGT